MGSLTSGPSVAASQPQIVYVPQTTSATTTTTSTTTSDTDATQTAQEQAAAQSEVRAQSLLDRERSTFGTIATSFRGLLGGADDDTATAPKTLLGE